jgi:hypothetical protein
MSAYLNEQKASLINKIMFANSQEEVQQFIDASVKSMQQNDKDETIVSDFVDKISNELYQFNPMINDAKQWSNIKMARIVVNRIRYHWDTVAY